MGVRSGKASGHPLERNEEEAWKDHLWDCVRSTCAVERQSRPTLPEKRRASSEGAFGLCSRNAQPPKDIVGTLVWFMRVLWAPPFAKRPFSLTVQLTCFNLID